MVLFEYNPITSQARMVMNDAPYLHWSSILVGLNKGVLVMTNHDTNTGLFRDRSMSTYYLNLGYHPVKKMQLEFPNTTRIMGAITVNTEPFYENRSSFMLDGKNRFNRQLAKITKYNRQYEQNGVNNLPVLSGNFTVHGIYGMIGCTVLLLTFCIIAYYFSGQVEIQ